MPEAQNLPQQIQQSTKETVDVAKDIILWTIDKFGGWTILGCIACGAFVILGLVFRNKMRSLFGDFVAWLNEFINGKDTKK